MRRARRDFCTVTSLGNVSCTRLSDYALEVYKDKNYANTWCYSANAGPANIASSCNDKISSLLLQPGWSVRVYRDQNQSGPSRCFTASDPDLSNNTFDNGVAMNNAVSSFTLYHQASCPPPISSISGQVKDSQGHSIANVTVRAGQYNAVTNNSGNYTINNVPAGNYTLRATKSGYTFSPSSRSINLPPNTNGQNFTGYRNYGALGGKITNKETGAAIVNARVSVGGQETTTNANGNYSFAKISSGPHKIHVTAASYHDYTGEVTIQANASKSRNVTLEPIPTDGYRLPFPGGKTYMVTQGYGGIWSHNWGTSLQYSLDWGIPVGQEVVAVRGGKVIEVRQNSYQGGCNSAYADDANVVGLLHADGTRTYYVHLQANSVPVNKGDVVKSGQTIGKVGLSGWVCGAHLHYHRVPQNSVWTAKTVFLDPDVSVHNGIPQQGWYYKSDNFPTLLLTMSSVESSQGDTTLPIGDIQFRLTGQPTYTLRINAFDYDSNIIQMRLAPTEANLVSAIWQVYTDTVSWTSLEAWAQFKDEADNLSEVYSDTVEAITYEPIEADFRVEPTICVGTIPEIKNLTTPLCEQCGWNWDLGDGNHSQAIEPVLPYPYLGYTNPGTYTITLNVSNVDRKSSTSAQVEVLPSPSPEFTVSRTGNTVTVEANATDAANWLWDFGDGITATGRIATHTYTATEIVERMPIIHLAVTGNNGCTSDAHQFVQYASPVYLPIIIK